jgi:predicted hotdog family 3-hydroxylacyl-ACP dehydratase
MIDFKRLNVADLLPHSGEMVLLDRIIEADETSLIAELQVRDDGLFGNDKTVPAWVGIEYMAQSVAAYAGLMATQQGEPIKLGFLLGTRRYHSNVSTFAVGTRLTVRVEKIIQDESLGMFSCHLYGEGINVQANLSTYQPPNGNPQ